MSHSVRIASVHSCIRPSSDLHVEQAVSRVVSSFNTWAFKREQPSDLSMLRATVQRAVQREEPLPFVLYWGKGPRSTLAPPDISCLDFLGEMAGRIRKMHAAGAAIHLVFTDTHANLNGHDPSKIDRYFSAVREPATARGFHCHWLRALIPDNDSFDVGAVEPDEHTLAMLERCARKWYGGGGCPTNGARLYFDMNMKERRAIEIRFPNSIFVTFNGSDCRPLFPKELPIFYMYSLKKGFAVKPWFLTELGTPYAAAA